MGQGLSSVDDPLLVKAKAALEAWDIYHVKLAYQKCLTLARPPDDRGGDDIAVGSDATQLARQHASNLWLTRAQFFSVFGPGSLDTSVIHDGKFLSLPLWFFDLFASARDKHLRAKLDRRRRALLTASAPTRSRMRRRGLTVKPRVAYASDRKSRQSGASGVPQETVSPQVSVRQLFTCLGLFCEGPLRERMHLCFHIFDADANMCMDRDEMKMFLREISRVLVILRVLPHMPHKAVLRHVADQAFSEADKDGSGEVDVDEFFEFAKSSLSCAILCDRFEHATKALVEDVTAKRRQEQERRGWFKRDTSARHAHGWSVRFIHQAQGVVPPRLGVLGDPDLAPSMLNETETPVGAKSPANKAHVARDSLDAEWAGKVGEARAHLKLMSSAMGYQAFAALLLAQRQARGAGGEAESKAASAAAAALAWRQASTRREAVTTVLTRAHTAPQLLSTGRRSPSPTSRAGRSPKASVGASTHRSDVSGWTQAGSEANDAGAGRALAHAREVGAAADAGGETARPAPQGLSGALVAAAQEHDALSAERITSFAQQHRVAMAKAKSAGKAPAEGPSGQAERGHAAVDGKASSEGSGDAPGAADASASAVERETAAQLTAGEAPSAERRATRVTSDLNAARDLLASTGIRLEPPAPRTEPGSSPTDTRTAAVVLGHDGPTQKPSELQQPATPQVINADMLRSLAAHHGKRPKATAEHARNNTKALAAAQALVSKNATATTGAGERLEATAAAVKARELAAFGPTPFPRLGPAEVSSDSESEPGTGYAGSPLRLVRERRAPVETSAAHGARWQRNERGYVAGMDPHDVPPWYDVPRGAAEEPTSPHAHAVAREEVVHALSSLTVSRIGTYAFSGTAEPRLTQQVLNTVGPATARARQYTARHPVKGNTHVGVDASETVDGEEWYRNRNTSHLVGTAKALDMTSPSPGRAAGGQRVSREAMHRMTPKPLNARHTVTRQRPASAPRVRPRQSVATEEVAPLIQQVASDPFSVTITRSPTSTMLASTPRDHLGDTSGERGGVPVPRILTDDEVQQAAVAAGAGVGVGDRGGRVITTPSARPASASARIGNRRAIGRASTPSSRGSTPTSRSKPVRSPMARPRSAHATGSRSGRRSGRARGDPALSVTGARTASIRPPPSASPAASPRLQRNGAPSGLSTSTAGTASRASLSTATQSTRASTASQSRRRRRRVRRKGPATARHNFPARSPLSSVPSATSRGGGAGYATQAQRERSAEQHKHRKHLKRLLSSLIHEGRRRAAYNGANDSPRGSMGRMGSTPRSEPGAKSPSTVGVGGPETAALPATAPKPSPVPPLGSVSRHLVKYDKRMVVKGTTPRQHERERGTPRAPVSERAQPESPPTTTSPGVGASQSTVPVLTIPIAFPVLHETQFDFGHVASYGAHAHRTHRSNSTATATTELFAATPRAVLQLGSARGTKLRVTPTAAAHSERRPSHGGIAK